MIGKPWECTKCLADVYIRHSFKPCDCSNSSLFHFPVTAAVPPCSQQSLQHHWAQAKEVPCAEYCRITLAIITWWQPGRSRIRPQDGSSNVSSFWFLHKDLSLLLFVVHFNTLLPFSLLNCHLLWSCLPSTYLLDYFKLYLILFLPFLSK